MMYAKKEKIVFFNMTNKRWETLGVSMKWTKNEVLSDIKNDLLS